MHRARSALTRQIRRKKTRARPKPKEARRPIRQHPLYGAIPLVPVQWTDYKGRLQSGVTYDLDYQPPLPSGAVRGDARSQHFCSLCHVPRYFFADQERDCVQCGRTFIFRGAEQKFWFETLKFHFDSVAIRCPECRRQRRTARGLQAQLQAARESARKAPDDPACLLGVAEALVRLHERTGQGGLTDAVATSRKARRLAQGPKARGLCAEALFWEGRAQDLRGRRDIAGTLYRAFLDSAPSGPRTGSLATEARRHLKGSAGAA